jgi:glycosyltransferase involved in cell wall biosynthesis
MLKNEKILILSLSGPAFGGAENHVLELYNMFVKNGYQTKLVLSFPSQIANIAKQRGYSFFPCKIMYSFKIRLLFRFLFFRYLKKLYKKEQFTTVICNNRREVPVVTKLAKHYNINVIFTRHVNDHFKTKQLKNVNSVIAVNPETVSYLQHKNIAENLNIKKIVFAPPLFNAQKFIDFQPTETSQEFFKKTFNINIQPCPTVCMIGNMVSDIEHKNYPLFFRAVDILVNKRNIPCNVMLAGGGPKEIELKALAQELKINHVTHFLGFTDQIPALIHYSDILAHASNKEAFGIIFLEAAIMKKPAIGATGTGAQIMIMPERTGLLFKNNDANDLADKLEQLIKDPDYARRLGNNAYEHIIQNFIPDVTFAKYAALCQEPRLLDQE